ncbi:DUF397 domain-containing protein [Amycolatopsis anabasis]|uniref:DUF397 domain-containing protein n=1 Tax=Amycolatopsis anabasis TaxID=1840409 RepID=UPI00131E421C|nr:DUF397 domain-containing protein [Amycolatopsis anabasis]
MRRHREITNWRKARRSVQNGDCVEVGWTTEVVGYRDTKQAGRQTGAQPMLLVSLAAHAAFLAAIQAGRVDSA